MDGQVKGQRGRPTDLEVGQVLAAQAPMGYLRGHYAERHAETRCQEAGRGIPRSRKRGLGAGRVRGWRSRMVLGSGRGAERRDKGPKGHPKGRPKG